MPKTAFITGITGQDGSYLAELLLSKGYQVLGLVRRLSSPNMGRIAHIINRVPLIEGDLTDQSSLVAALQMAQPDEIYNLAAQSFARAYWEQPLLTAEVSGLGALRLFEAVRQTCKNAKVFQASTSEMFGKTDEFPQSEKTRFHPVSPYACAKVFAHHSAITYRESYGMFICCGILFNHESPRRGIEFVTRKITDGVAKISKGLAKELRLGNLEAQRDWGFAGDYVKAMWLMLQQDQPEEYVIATGEMHSVAEFADLAFKQVGLDWRDYTVVDERFERPVDVERMAGDATKARERLSWKPEVSFPQLVEMMVQADLALLSGRSPKASTPFQV